MDHPGAVRYYLSLELVQVCEKEISHMGKNNGNPDLECEKNHLPDYIH